MIFNEIAAAASAAIDIRAAVIAAIAAAFAGILLVLYRHHKLSK
ncbi:MAG: hypothetical protein PUK54_01785 [Firmicutes bacterium]|nr:hypothetical protein [Bacillota bacterium]MDY5856287.1 hypothetical protein [Anaerovoracaceae bacterium]